MHNSSLPLPHPDAVAHSHRLVATIKQTIQEAGGVIPFVEFMAQALYAPGLGYYSAGVHKLGASGDFITAPEISPLFSQCIAKQCQQVLTTFPDGVILEFGAGSGIMAAEILKTLASFNCLPTQYLILEVSADLRQRQRATLQAKIPELLNRVQWLDVLPSQPLHGIILANEVLDAMPVQRFRLDEQGVSEFYVGLANSDNNPTETPFIWQMLPTRDESLLQAVEMLRLSLPVGYVSEMNLALSAWIQSLADILAGGLVLLIDYGFPSREYYHPQRDQGTLMCHYQHHAHDDPLILAGLQDITAHVNFTAIAETALTANLQVSGYTNQANFLLACGLPELLSALDFNETKTYLQQTQQAKTLVLPSEMGELFKVMALTSHLDIPLLGFVRDERGRL
ncbi:SAM-dependent methyltransferase [Candidatus Parabeggiatoa sp. HSG14]|uniref:class I SAM-dependent methyltransferase n=1 Tax=Candidatus Parabeggiatoa sp. HSG14 TaxID=3055593 RepID=UPI0025A897F8|nr:SAM-dependent methyltransferase [Thiotrichales bacterium HSG14]